MTGEELAQRVREVMFTPVRFREGYDMGEVDDLLDQLAAALEQGCDVDGLTRVDHLTRVRWREGYAMDEVDDLLSGIRRTWR